MNPQIIEINKCNHYLLNADNLGEMYFIHDESFVEIDSNITHPFGTVYKPKRCLDTNIRFVKQLNNSTLMFRSNEWDNNYNPFHKKESFFSKFRKKFLSH